jgi:ABC-type uncharacterized transport system substrate-binding protein
MIDRRAVIFGIGAVSASQPYRASAESGKVFRVGLMITTAPTSQMAGMAPGIPPVRAFIQGLRDLGYVEGRNLILERRSAEGRIERLPEIVGDLLRRKVDVIVTSGGNHMTIVAKQLTRHVPIVMTNSDNPVAAGLVEQLSRPGGNITGFVGNTSPEFEAKRVQLLKEAFPLASRVSFLGPESEWLRRRGKSIRSAADALGMKLFHADCQAGNYQRAFSQIVQEQPQAVFVARHPLNFGNRKRIADFSAKHQLPTVFPWREAVVAGGLMSYGTSLVDLFRRAAGQVDKLLKGARPSEMPVERALKFELVVNLRTAKALGITIPLSILVRADEAIE